MRKRWFALLGLVVVAACGDNIQINIIDPEVPPDTTEHSDSTGTTQKGRWLGEFVPKEDTIHVTESVYPVARVLLPSASSRKLEALRSGECVAVTEISVVAVQADTFEVKPRIVGTATCTSMVTIRFVDNPSEARTVTIHVVSASPVSASIKLVPHEWSGPVGTRFQAGCEVVVPPLLSSKCGFYTTNPTVLAIMPDTVTLTSQSGPWAPGTYPGGLIHPLNPGTTQTCTYLVADAKVADCGSYTVTGPSGISSYKMTPTLVPVGWGEVPEALRPYIW